VSIVRDFLSYMPHTLQHILQHTMEHTLQRTLQHTVGCSSGIRGFYENLVTLKYPKLPDFEWAQKVRLKKCSP